jgi:hypothetical protein
MEKIMNNRLPCDRHGRRARSAGLTLVELLVAAIIIVVVVLVVGRILTTAQAVVNGSEAIIRANNQAAAFKQIVRQDISRITRQGFLCIAVVQGEDHFDHPMLIASSDGPTPSLTGGNPGNGAIFAIGQCVEGNSPTTKSLIFHHARVLNGINGTGADRCEFVFDLADVTTTPRCTGTFNINYMIGQLVDSARPTASDPYLPRKLYVPAKNPSDISKLWKTLAVYVPTTNNNNTNAPNLRIAWTDGSQNLNSNVYNWYGFDDCWVNNNAWVIKANSKKTLDNDATKTEFLDSNNKYRALFTKDNLSEWPVLIRIRFTLKDPLGQKELTTQTDAAVNPINESSTPDYEIVCPVGQ